jgi:hypothetical protein
VERGFSGAGPAAWSEERTATSAAISSGVASGLTILRLGAGIAERSDMTAPLALRSHLGPLGSIPL